MGLIYLDSCIVIYLIERVERRYEELTSRLAELTDDRVCVSPLVKAECLVGPLRAGNESLLREYVDWFEAVPTIDVDEPSCLLAAELRAGHGLKMIDALHVATARRHGCMELWTNDARMDAAASGFARHVFRDRPR